MRLKWAPLSDGGALPVLFATYATDVGRGLIDRRLYLPQSWCEDTERRAAAGVPADVTFQTKPQLATDMLAAAIAANVPFCWVTADEAFEVGWGAVDEVAQGPAQSIEPPDHEGVAGAQEVEGLLQTGPVRLGTTGGIGEQPLTAGLGQRVLLEGEGLVCGGDAGVADEHGSL